MLSAQRFSYLSLDFSTFIDSVLLLRFVCVGYLSNYIDGHRHSKKKSFSFRNSYIKYIEKCSFWLMLFQNGMKLGIRIKNEFHFMLLLFSSFDSNESQCGYLLFAAQFTIIIVYL